MGATIRNTAASAFALSDICRFDSQLPALTFLQPLDQPTSLAPTVAFEGCGGSKEEDASTEMSQGRGAGKGRECDPTTAKEKRMSMTRRRISPSVSVAPQLRPSRSHLHHQSRSRPLPATPPHSPPTISRLSNKCSRRFLSNLLAALEDGGHTNRRGEHRGHRSAEEKAKLKTALSKSSIFGDCTQSRAISSLRPPPPARR